MVNIGDHGGHPGGEGNLWLPLERVVGAPSKEAMGQLLADIRSGTFAKEFVDEMDAGSPNFNRLREEGRTHQIETVGAELRAMMPWLKRR